MANPLLGQILGAAFGSRLGPAAPSGAPAAPSGFPGGLGGAALGGLVAAMAGRGGGQPSRNRGLLLAMLLPLAMRWVQQNGGLASVLQRFRSSGLGAQADSWVSGGPNRDISAQDVQRVVGPGEIEQFATRLGVAPQEVSQAFAEIMPELADKLTPQGTVHPQAGEALDHGSGELEKALGELHATMQAAP